MSEKGEKSARGPASTPQSPSASQDLVSNILPPAVLEQANAVASTANHGQNGPHELEALSPSPIENLPPPPPYSEGPVGQVDLYQNGVSSGARVADDGRVDIKIDQLNRQLTRMLTRQMTGRGQRQDQEPYIPSGLGSESGLPCPPLNIVIQVVGSRGDVQPFVALGQVLKNKYNHRVRLATHPVFRDFVTENGLEFFSIGGDPAELMAYMVKNPGLIPGMETLKSGEIGKKRRSIYEMLNGCWRSCIEPGDGTGPPLSDETLSSKLSIEQLASLEDPNLRPFVADAIIANPPSFAHVHIAEKMGIPLHLMFTMPWSPTAAYPHPLANIVTSDADTGLANYMSYILVDVLTWNGTGDVFNRFREKVLNLEPMSTVWAPGVLHRLQIPWTYAWSPALIPKPFDWPNFIDLAGFYFLDLASNYVPPADLAQFLATGPPPVYIGFGSIVVDDPNAMTKMIFEAVKITGQRALVSKGWGGLSADEMGLPEGVFMLGNCPHDWLFDRVSAVVHHGGAGTTAAGVKAGRPTMIVPFFGDQPFWGNMVHQAGAGPKPIPYKDLTAAKLAESIIEALKPESLQRAQELSAKIKNENGPDNGADSFHKFLNTDELRCSLTPGRAAVWRIKRTNIRLSALAATVLANEHVIDFSDLKLHRSREYEVDTGPIEPISGGAAAIVGTIGGMTAGIADFPAEVLRSFRTASDGVKRRQDRQDSLHSPESHSNAASSIDLSGTPDMEKHTPGVGRANSSSTSIPQSKSTQDVSTDSERGRSGVRSSSSTAGDSVTTPPGSQGGHRELLRGIQRCPSQDAARITLDSAVGSAKAASHIIGIGLKSPLDFTMSLAKGFHNIPRLYNDKTVRPTEKVTGLQSGLKAAGKNFAYGFIDGVGGLVTQPILGFKEEGAPGIVKGLVKGSFGLVVKPGAAIWGLPAYTMQGIYAEIAKNFGKSTTNYIIAARMAQGYEDYKNSGEGEREHIIAVWESSDLQDRYQNRRGRKDKADVTSPTVSSPIVMKDRLVDEHGELLTGFRNTKHLTFDERKELARRKQELQQNVHLSVVSPRPQSEQAASIAGTSEDEFRDAIRTAVEQTSTNDTHEDRAIGNAIWAGVRELQRTQSSIAEASDVRPAEKSDDGGAYERAVAASVAEYKRTHAQRPGQESGVIRKDNDQADNGSYDDDQELTRAITASLEEYTRGTTSAHQPEPSTDRTPSPGTDEDEDYKRAIQESMKSQQPETSNAIKGKPLNPPPYASSAAAGDPQHPLQSRPDGQHPPSDGQSSHDAELQEALRLSEIESKERTEELDRQKTEEDIVMEYIKKQSLQEEEYRQKKLAEAREEGANHAGL